MHIYRGLNPIKALCFDLDDTLYDNQPIIQNLENQIVRWLHQHHPITTSLSMPGWQEIKKAIVEEEPALRHDVTLWRKKQIERGLLLLGYDEPKAIQSAQEAITHALWLRNLIEVPEQSHVVMRQLAKAFPLVAITNGNVDPDIIGLGGYFDLILRAGPNGRSKPFSDMFDQAARHLELPPNQILHIGDHPVTDVYGAKTSGYMACWLNLSGTHGRKNARLRALPDIEINDINELLCLIKP